MEIKTGLRTEVSDHPAETHGKDGRDALRVRLVLLSFLMLFVELALIRWAGSNVLYLSYFSNFILLGSFLGIGIGFLRARATRDLFPFALVSLAVLVFFVLGFPVEIDRSGGSLLYFGNFEPSGLSPWVILPLIFVVVALTMAMIAEGVARTFARFEPLEAYRLDILGSIAGIVGFSVLSFLHAPPFAWGVVAALVFLILYGRATTLLHVVAAFVLLLALGYESLRPGDSWSPYYKVSTQDQDDGRVEISVNGIPHQMVASNRWRRAAEPIYFLPYERRAQGTPERVLVVGAGNGSDVAAALEQGAQHVDAVEIDPRLLEIGREVHPEAPYSDLRVTAHTADGRAFLERGERDYDMILFALPDSLTLVSGQSSLRLESFLFTEEALATAKKQLAPGGVFAMYNYYREQWLVDRLANSLKHVFGPAPCVDVVGGRGKLALLTAAEAPSSLNCAQTWAPTSANVEAPVSDDHPFLYLKGNGIPGVYLMTILLILGASVVMIRSVSGPLRQMSRYVDLFLMGAAFLLLETKNVVQFALLFGTTWFVNALVFAGILVSVLGAIEVARRVRIQRPARLYRWLFVALAVAWVIPQHWLLNLPVTPRFIVAVLLAFTPIFLANLVFAERFKGVGSSTVAFGANLLGAMAGGILEYGSLVVGYRSLLLVAAAIYAVAYLSGRDHLVPASAST